MLTPGFSIKNETIWPLQISLSQAGPLYFDVIQPGQWFTRDTGAVWFTLKAAIFLDEKDRITNWDAVTPIAIAVGSAVLTIATAGAAGFASGAMAVATIAGAVTAAGIKDLSTNSVVSTVTAASSLEGAGFSKTASMVVEGRVIDPKGTLSPGAEAALNRVFSTENISLRSAGCYAGPPWPFRRELTPLRITGGPTFRRVPNQDLVELVPGRMNIDAQPPPAAYGTFSLQTGTALAPTDANFRFLVAANGDLFAIKVANTGNGKTEVHILTAASGYKQYALQTGTALEHVDNTWEFGVAGNRDLFAIRKRNTGSGKTEVHVLSAASGYQRFSSQHASALGPCDDTWTFALAHNRDVVAIKKSATDSNTTEVHILSASSNFQGFELQTKTALPTADDTWTFDIAHNRDIFAFKKNHTGSGTCEVHVLAAHATYQSYDIQTKTALHEIDDTWALCLAEDRSIMAIRRSGGGSNSTELHVIKA